MISCFQNNAPKNRKQCLRTSFVATLVNRSAEFFAASLCRRKRSKTVASCLPYSTKVLSNSIRRKRSHIRRASEVNFSKTYKIGKTLGVGGFSVVKTGVNILTGEPVAIKIIDRSKYGPRDGSLEREIQVLEKVQHPNCIGFKDCFFSSNSVYLVTELVTGGELLDRVLAKGKYSEAEAADTIYQILMGVAYLHSIGIIHRDLKLENILLQSSENDSVVKIADFGLSKIFGGAAILSTVCGSPQYVAPEVLEVGQQRSSYSPAADLWSVGVILYILLSGFSPFDDVSESALFKKIKKGQYSFQAPVWETISDAAKDLVCGLLCVSPDNRLTARVALAHPWIKQHVKSENQDEPPAGIEATSELELLVNLHHAQLPPCLETSESSDDDDDDSELPTSSQSTQQSDRSYISLKAETFSNWTKSASNLHLGTEDSQSTYRSQSPQDRSVTRNDSRASLSKHQNPWRHMAALKKRLESERKSSSTKGRYGNTRFDDMNF